MDHNEETTEKLIQYLDGELSEDEQKAIEQLLSKDEAMQNELHNLELAQEAVRSYGLKNQVAAVRKEMLESMAGARESSKPKVYPFARLAMRYAAVLVFAFLSVSIYLYATTSSFKLYQDNYQPYKISVTRGEGRAGAIESAFNAANYHEVISAFKKIASPTNRDYLLVAQAYQLTRDYKDAIASYTRLISLQSPDNLFHDDAEYYLALTYLENRQPAKAKPIFEKIYSNPDHLYHDKVSFWMMLRLKMLVIME